MTASLSNGLFAKDTLLLGSRDGYPEIRQLLQERLRDIVALFNTAGKETMTVLNIEAACDAIYVRPNLNILVAERRTQKTAGSSRTSPCSARRSVFEAGVAQT